MKTQQSTETLAGAGWEVKKLLAGRLSLQAGRASKGDNGRSADTSAIYLGIHTSFIVSDSYELQMEIRYDKLYCTT